MFFFFILKGKWSKTIAYQTAKKQIEKDRCGEILCCRAKASLIEANEWDGALTDWLTGWLAGWLRVFSSVQRHSGHADSSVLALRMLLYCHFSSHSNAVWMGLTTGLDSVTRLHLSLPSHRFGLLWFPGLTCLEATVEMSCCPSHGTGPTFSLIHNNNKKRIA